MRFVGRDGARPLALDLDRQAVVSDPRLDLVVQREGECKRVVAGSEIRR
jgi:hypothetical protein